MNRPRARRSASLRAPAGPQIRLVNVGDAIAPFRDLRRRIVGRAVVNDDDFVVAIGLGEHRLERGPDGPSRVERRNRRQ